ncbi:MAG: DUF4911 domain-containing protein [Thermosipho sp. (in: Bacteria)]|nr:DUF4911 domain-containing protein [Thermosipho sp. (in: thermotogales)]MCD6105444.1 DUF4911 domain-containing protein [Thermosipho sp. (in: thermotogales)]
MELEKDILIKIDKEKVHILSYILESEDNLVNVRKYENGILRLIVPNDLIKKLLIFLEDLENKIGFEILEIKENSGSAD